MAKKIKFPLIMKDDVQVRAMEELKEHFDLEKVCEYFSNGKLLTWLEERYYEDEAEQIRELDAQDSNLKKKLCDIFGVEWHDMDSVDMEAVALRQEKLAKLKQYTSDEEILSKVEFAAFDQEELADLLDEDAKEIILCDNRFVIPTSRKGIHYIGVGNAVAEIKSREDLDFDKLGICFYNLTISCLNSIKMRLSDCENIITVGNAVLKSTQVQYESLFKEVIPSSNNAGATGIGLFSKNLESQETILVDCIIPKLLSSEVNKDGYIYLAQNAVKEINNTYFYVRQKYQNAQGYSVRRDQIICCNKDKSNAEIIISSDKLIEYWGKLGIPFANGDIMISLENFFLIDDTIVFDAGYYRTNGKVEMFFMVATTNGVIKEHFHKYETNDSYLVGGNESIRSAHSFIVYCDSQCVLYIDGEKQQLCRFELSNSVMTVIDDIKYRYQLGIREAEYNTFFMDKDDLYYLKSLDKRPIVYDKGPFYVMKYNLRTEKIVNIKKLASDDSLSNFTLYKTGDEIYFTNNSIFNAIRMQCDASEAMYDQRVNI